MFLIIINQLILQNLQKNKKIFIRIVILFLVKIDYSTHLNYKILTLQVKIQISLFKKDFNQNVKTLY
jgi:hypothetical protein